MKAIEIVLDEKLLLAADRAARRSNVDRSELVCEALRECLKRMELQTNLDREGYLKQPHTRDEWEIWQKVAMWPEE